MPLPGKLDFAGTGEPALPDSDELDTVPDVSGPDRAHLFDYCRALLGHDAEAARAARSVLDSAHVLHQEPDRLRARLFALGRTQALTVRPPSGDEPSYMPLALIAAPNQETDNGVLRAFRALTDRDREVLDLVYRHGIRAANLPEVLAIPSAEAYRRLAVAEAEYVSLTAEPAASDANSDGNADAQLEDIAALPLAAMPAAAADTATPLPQDERRLHRRPARLVAAAVVSAATIGAVVYVGAASHPTGSRAATSPGSVASLAGPRTGAQPSAHAARPAHGKHVLAPGQPVFPWVPVISRNATPSPSIPVVTQFTGTVAPVPCPPGTTANFRWHYTASGSAGGWSGTATQTCPGGVTMGPQAMDGNLQVTPGTALQAGFDFTMPGNNNSLVMTVAAARVTVAVSCVSKAAPLAPTITVPLQALTFQITGDQWYPSGDQSSPLVYQGSISVPALCGAGGTISLAKGGVFTATLG